MFLSIDNPIITDESSFLDRLSLGGQTLLLGMAVVFAMLFVIYLCMIAMQAVFTRKSAKPAKSTASEKPVETPEPAMQVTESVPDTQTSDEQLVAAITAAIAAYTGDAPSSFRVVSFKKR